jgi:rhamnogalacturonan endolyase
MNRVMYLRILIGGFLWLLGTTASVRAEKPCPAVVVTENATTATLSNGIVSATINKANGNLLSLKHGGVESLSKGGGYWNLYGNIPGQAKTEQKPTPASFRISHDPSKNGGALGEVVLTFPYRDQPKAVPFDIEIRYSLHRGDSGLYGWTIADHDPKYPAFDIVAGTMCLKLNPDVFDYLSVDSRRQRQMVRPEEWVQGQQLNLWEARRINTGIHKGEVEHKYDYAAMFSQTPAYGWSSSKQKVGVWIVNPSIEYINGSPTMIELTGHIDVKATLPADPVLLFIWHGPHYGGRGIQIKAEERWRKIIGPFVIYCNGGESHEAMWKDALSRAEREKKAWPYAWADAPGYEHTAQRGSVSGRLVVKDPQAPKANAAGAWVGLVHPPYEATFAKGGPITIDWQTDGKHYQYWAKADAEGHFTIANVRPGTYTLYAFTNGVLGDFSRADVRVEAGKTNTLGDLIWVPVRYGKQLWEIGVPDRSAAEFLHGDHYWQWGLYNLYPKEFPNGVDYVIGKSDWRRDWNYAQPPVPDGKDRWKKSTWRIRFDLERACRGTATLRLAICGARGGPVDVAVNDRSIGSTGELPESGVMHRDGIRGVEIERNLKFDASILKAGENVVELTKQARNWTEGVLYDYLRLELNEAGAAEAVDDAKPLVSKYVGVYTHPPNTVGSLDPSIHAYRIPDGPLMGNGDIAVAVGGTDTEQTFYLSKSDLSHSVRGLGGVTLSFEGPAAHKENYRQEQDLYRAEIRSLLPVRKATIRMRSWTADDGNILVTDLSTVEGVPVDVVMKLWSHPRFGHLQAGTEKGLLWTNREVNIKMGTSAQSFSAKVAVATRIVGATPECSTDGKNSSTARFTVPAGKTVKIVTIVAGGYKAENPIEKAKDLASSLTNRKIDDRYAAHLDWWKKYWSKSSIALNDDLLEKFYYGALYVLGCSSRAGNVPPGLAGPWHLNGPICWSNKYTLDYNFEAVWWGVYSSNRPELAMPYYDVILKLIPEGRRLARENGTKGVLFGVNAHAWGGFTDTRTLNMKGNASLAALNFIMHYHYTQDEGFLVDKAWPLLKELTEFWEDNLIRDETTKRWSIHDSGAREGQKDTNPITDLSYVNSLFKFLLETCDTLEGKQSGGEVIHITDAQKAKWRSYVADLSAYPTMIFNGKKVFKEAENRTKMSLGGAGDNSDILGHVFPAEALSLGSDPELLQMARNTVAALNPDMGKASWFQANSFPKIYTQAVRSGYPAEKIVASLKLLLEGHQPYDDRGDHVQLRDNLTIVPPVHSYEYVGAIEAIHSMLLQSHDRTIRVFPVWLKGKDAWFRNLRAYGSFLISSEYKNGAVAYVNINSEVGGTCTVANPWKGAVCEVVSLCEGKTNKVDFRMVGNAIVFATKKGCHYRVRKQSGGEQ